MANYSITAANVLWLGGTPIQKGVAGATIAAGEAIRIDTATGKLILVDADLSPTITGIALSSATLNQPVHYAITGARLQLALAGLDVSGTPVFASDTAGKLMPQTDVNTGTFSGRYPIFVGFLQDVATPKNIDLSFASSVDLYND